MDINVNFEYYRRCQTFQKRFGTKVSSCHNRYQESLEGVFGYAICTTTMLLCCDSLIWLLCIYSEYYITLLCSFVEIHWLTKRWRFLIWKKNHPKKCHRNTWQSRKMPQSNNAGTTSWKRKRPTSGSMKYLPRGDFFPCVKASMRVCVYAILQQCCCAVMWLLCIYSK